MIKSKIVVGLVAASLSLGTIGVISFNSNVLNNTTNKFQSYIYNFNTALVNCYYEIENNKTIISNDNNQIEKDNKQIKTNNNKISSLEDTKKKLGKKEQRLNQPFANQQFVNAFNKGNYTQDTELTSIQNKLENDVAEYRYDLYRNGEQAAKVEWDPYIEQYTQQLLKEEQIINNN